MTAATQSMSSLLAINISPVVIQACLIIRQEEYYQVVGVGHAPVSYGLQGALDRKCLIKVLHDLAKKTGHDLLGENNDILTPSENQERGVDKLCLTWSMPSSIKVVLVSLMPAWSLKAGSRLIEEIPVEIVGQISIMDGRTDEEKMDSILSLRPDLIVLTGGVEDGAVEVVKSSVNLVARSLSGLPAELRPEVFYAGSSQVADYAKNRIEPHTMILSAPNIQPSLDLLDLQPAREVLSGICNRMWLKRFGLQPGARSVTFDITRLSPQAIEDFIAILGMCEKHDHGALAIQLNELSTGVSISLDGKSMSYQPMGSSRPIDPGKLVGLYRPEDVAVWCPTDVDPISLADHLMAEVLYPGRLPVTVGDVNLSESLTRVAGMRAWQTLSAKPNFPRRLRNKKACADVDLILIGGDRLHYENNHGRTLLEMLDIIQPIGISEVFIDIDDVAASVGATAHLNPLIAAHCIGGQAVSRLATVVAPDFKGRDGLKLLTLTVTYEDGSKATHRIKSGSLTSIPLEPLKKARLKITPRAGVRMGTRFEWNRDIPVVESLLGIVVDARGRPLQPRKDLKAQQLWMKRSIEQAQLLVR